MQAKTGIVPWILLAALAGCKPGAGPQAATLPPVEVPVAKPLPVTVVDFEEYTGKVMAIERVNIMARADGYLSEIRFKPGEFVHKDDVLFVIDPRPYKAALDSAEAQLAQAEARVSRLTKEHTRLDKLRTTGAGSTEDFEKVEGELAEARATVQGMKANVQQAQLNLNFTEVKAPVDGRVGRQMVTVGNLVQGSTANATVLTDLVSVEEMYVFFEAPERDVLRYRRTMVSEGRTDLRENPIEVEIGLFDEDGYPHPGIVDFAHERLDPGTGTQTFRARVKNPGGTLFADGMFARVKVAFSKPYQSLAVSDRAIVTIQGGKFLFIVNAEDKVEERQVQLGRLIGPGLRQIKSGIQASDRVAVSNIQRLMPGATVVPAPTEMPLPPKAAK
jgi:RND family efflux transporter MFP subunit